MRDIGKNLKQLREQKGLKQEQLAELLFVTRQTVSNYENGRSRPDIETLMKIAELLETDVNHILYGPPVPEDKRRAHRQLIFATAMTFLYGILWFCCEIIFSDLYLLHYDTRIRGIGLMFCRPMFFLFLGWLLPALMGFMCHAKSLQYAWGKYVRWLLILVTSVFILVSTSYLFNFILALLFPATYDHFIDFPIIGYFAYEISFLILSYPWVYTVLGALLWLFGFPQKKEK